MFDEIFKTMTFALLVWLGYTHAQLGSYVSAFSVITYAGIFWVWAFTDFLK